MEKSTTWGEGCYQGDENWVSHIGQKLIQHTTIVISFYIIYLCNYTIIMTTTNCKFTTGGGGGGGVLQ